MTTKPGEEFDKVGMLWLNRYVQLPSAIWVTREVADPPPRPGIPDYSSWTEDHPMAISASYRWSVKPIDPDGFALLGAAKFISYDASEKYDALRATNPTLPARFTVDPRLTGLRIDGEAVEGTLRHDWKPLDQTIKGIRLEDENADEVLRMREDRGEPEREGVPGVRADLSLPRVSGSGRTDEQAARAGRSVFWASREAAGDLDDGVDSHRVVGDGADARAGEDEKSVPGALDPAASKYKNDPKTCTEMWDGVFCPHCGHKAWKHRNDRR